MSLFLLSIHEKYIIYYSLLIMAAIFLRNICPSWQEATQTRPTISPPALLGQVRSPQTFLLALDSYRLQFRRHIPSIQCRHTRLHNRMNIHHPYHRNMTIHDCFCQDCLPVSGNTDGSCDGSPKYHNNLHPNSTARLLGIY